MLKKIPKVILKPEREKSLLRKHPWVFSGAIQKIEKKDLIPGDIVQVVSSGNNFLGYGTININSQIVVRIWSYNQEILIDRDFIREKLSVAFNLRNRLIKNTNSLRLFFSESDGIPGLIIDKYNDIIVCQFLTAGADQRKNDITDIINEFFPDIPIYERSDSEMRKTEALAKQSGFLSGDYKKDFAEIKENNCKFYVDFKKGHKTGFYLDQRDNREFTANLFDKKKILNCFSYTGGFSIYALISGAEQAVNIDESEDALNLLEKNLELNNISPAKNRNIRGNAFHILRDMADKGEKFDVIVLDPPKFIKSKNHIISGARGYKDINILAFKLLNKNGILLTFSCSGLLERDLFQKIVADAALDAKKDAKIIKYLSQGIDHPISSNFPEALYLKGLLCAVE
jgi:23S rRNA (cytosine1962-C5)-methyltransferase